MLLGAEELRRAEPALGGAKVLICQLEISPDTSLQALSMARERQVRTIFNPAPAVPDLHPDFYRYSDVFCCNEPEAELLTGMAVGSVEDAGKVGAELLGRGCGSVIVTLGPQGCVVLSSQDPTPRHIATTTVTALDTTPCESQGGPRESPPPDAQLCSGPWRGLCGLCSWEFEAAVASGAGSSIVPVRVKSRLHPGGMCTPPSPSPVTHPSALLLSAHSRRPAVRPAIVGRIVEPAHCAMTHYQIHFRSNLSRSMGSPLRWAGKHTHLSHDATVHMSGAATGAIELRHELGLELIVGPMSRHTKQALIIHMGGFWEGPDSGNRSESMKGQEGCRSMERNGGFFPGALQGAGDSFIGALAFYMADYPIMPLEEMARRANQVAAVSVQAVGTQTSYPFRKDLPKDLL
ncbi:hypothetical protein JZ751_003178 [Albula glossodonta]|uniref:Carbohydrate kinase PfkB domain-containing protein n=1 Tax=Albula glossodonta TaxID=121402 RepID=A0A8T2NBY8_9TELE|nr:hypothetical protein JZ751_003178 [Albula glossodonta]